ncbi:MULTISPECIES: guanylate kinase [Pseudanabaena]|jgi:guanylate kinase|uniref:guanylate kinase n=1 Tax=Pseudanabaena TaxID=1152 RepID=UPI002479A5B7|nr:MULTISPECIES: guanylate kinase [Pseudanabaena]MEA5485949.1 guanylate kinase [Pseudanabaena sp. CCNP1317]WGS71367.1 guanylate kinase [Pseudanabaena galeata CCNP1313]
MKAPITINSISRENYETLSEDNLSVGKLIVVTGPSGVGKGTLLQKLLERYPDRILFSISATTRSPRTGEEHGREYFFWDRAEFEQKRDTGEFLEWAEYAGNLYGTPRKPIDQAIALGQIVLLEIELEGARQVAQSFPSAKRIFIAPPSMEVLENRLRDRSTDSDEQIIKRLRHAKLEVAAAHEFDITIINDDLEIALQQLESAMFD